MVECIQYIRSFLILPYGITDFKMSLIGFAKEIYLNMNSKDNPLKYLIMPGCKLRRLEFITVSIFYYEKVVGSFVSSYSRNEFNKEGNIVLFWHIGGHQQSMKTCQCRLIDIEIVKKTGAKYWDVDIIISLVIFVFIVLDGFSA